MCFWVGKGHGKRAHKLKRNHYYNNVVKKLAKNGMCIEVRMVSSGLSEGDAFSLEKARISFWRSQGIKLANLTDGGEGASGFKHSDDAKRALADLARQRWQSDAYRDNQIKGGRQRWDDIDPKIRSEYADRASKQWQDPEFRAVCIEGSRKQMADPEFRAMLNAAISSPGIREKMSASAKKRCTEEWRINKSKSQSEFLSDPDIRAKFADFVSTPENKIKRDATNRLPENRARAAERARHQWIARKAKSKKEKS